MTSKSLAPNPSAGETIIHLELGRPDFDTPAHIKAAAIKALEEGKVHYSSNYGIPELRAAIADKFKRDNKLDYDPAAEIIVTIGATEAIFMTMMALLNPGDEALIPMPAFPAYTRCVYMAGARPSGNSSPGRTSHRNRGRPGTGSQRPS